MALATYLGRPESAFGMQAVPDPEPGGSAGSGGVASSLGRSTATSTLISGGVATLRKPYTKRSYQVQWSILTPAEIDLLMSFYDGRQGGGPYCLMDPSWGNQLPANVSAMGAVIGAVPEWSPTAGTLVVSTQAGPTGVLSGVATWSGTSNGSILYEGLNNVIDGTWLPPVIPGLSHGHGISAKLISGTSASLTGALMYGLGGSAPAGTATATAATVALNGTWQDVSAIVASGFSWPGTADYAQFKLTVSNAVGSPVIGLSAPWFNYSATTAAKPNTSGLGVPRVLVTGDVPTPVAVIGFRDWTMTLQEA